MGPITDSEVLWHPRCLLCSICTLRVVLVQPSLHKLILLFDIQDFETASFKYTLLKIILQNSINSFIYLHSGLLLFFKLTADGDCSLEIERHLLLGKNVMTNLDSI